MRYEQRQYKSPHPTMRSGFDHYQAGYVSSFVAFFDASVSPQGQPLLTDAHQADACTWRNETISYFLAAMSIRLYAVRRSHDRSRA